MPIGDRHLPDMAWDGNRKLAARGDGAGQHVSDRTGAGIAGHPREEDRVAVPGRGFDGEWPPADDDEDDRRPGRDDRVEQFLLTTVEPERRSVPELAGRRVEGESGALAEDEDRRVAGA